MADYIYIDNMTGKGKIGISYLAFESLVQDAINQVPGITRSAKQLKKNQYFRLNRPIKISIKNEVVHVWVAIDIDENSDEKKIVALLENEIHSAFESMTEQVPFDIEIKVEKIKVGK